MVEVAHAIVDRGATTARGKGYLQWHGPNDNGTWLGTSHGTAGVLYNLLHVQKLSHNTTARTLIAATLTRLLQAQLPSGNFPAEYFQPDDDVLVQWDHGAPGVSTMLWKAAEVLAQYHDTVELSRNITSAAIMAQDCAWRRGLVTKGLMNCHGISGNTFSMYLAYQATRNETYLYRALQFQELVVSTPELSTHGMMRVPSPADLNWALWVGTYGSAIMLWSDVLYGSPLNVSMSGYTIAI
eukprot:TRINITY_DN10716_c0_g1_i10.p1 TRINITY_DN10716_c0_g1~~TRINITY_DN10716_c0_g1_i10.p1  ORF type:complete len:240 (+),score=17.56 TRINITY_DN10716_c0_g1_i10:791-1510(+)